MKIGISNCFLVIVMILSSCQQKSDSDYVKNLEEQNKKLQEQLYVKDEIKLNDSLRNSGTSYSSTKPSSSKIEDFSLPSFTIGSTEKEVIDLMGEPTSVSNSVISKEKTLYYGLSTIHFKNNKVVEYSNSGNNLKVRYTVDTDINQDEAKIKVGKTKPTKWIYFFGSVNYNVELKSFYSKIYEI